MRLLEARSRCSEPFLDPFSASSGWTIDGFLSCRWVGSPRPCAFCRTATARTFMKIEPGSTKTVLVCESAVCRMAGKCFVRIW